MKFLEVTVVNDPRLVFDNLSRPSISRTVQHRLYRPIDICSGGKQALMLNIC